MTDWYVEVVAGAASPLGERAAAVADTVMDELARHGAAVSVARDWLRVGLTVEGPDPPAALARGLALVDAALRAAGLAGFRVRAVRILDEAELDEELARPNLPALVGVAEIAARLGVSRQRVSELARSRGFPPALARLSAGPVWLEAAVDRFARDWTRRPGRPAPEPDAPAD
jgi:transcriptional regulator with XRE-family HTH domain